VDWGLLHCSFIGDRQCFRRMYHLHPEDGGNTFLQNIGNHGTTTQKTTVHNSDQKPTSLEFEKYNMHTIILNFL
jgi:hypothetical protein